MSSENLFLKQKSLRINHGHIAQFFCWWGQAHWMWMDIYFWHRGHWVICCCLDCHLCGDLTADWSLMPLLPKRALHSLFTEHVLPGLYVYCVLWAAQIWFQPPWEPALPPTPSLCSWCVSQGCGDIQGWSEESIFHLFDQLERAEMLAACFFRLHQQNSMLNCLCQCCLGRRRLFCIFSVPSRTSSGEVHDSYLGNRLGEGLLATSGKLVSLLPAPLLHPMPSYFLGSWFLVFGGYG